MSKRSKKRRRQHTAQERTRKAPLAREDRPTKQHAPLTSPRWPSHLQKGAIAIGIGLCGIVAQKLHLFAAALLIQGSVAVIALLLAGFQLVNTFIWRVRIHHWRDRILRNLILQELTLAAIVPLGIAAIGGLSAPSLLTFTAMSALILVVAYSYESIQQTIWKRVEQCGYEHGTDAIAGARARGVGAEEDETRRDYLNRTKTSPVRAAFAWLLEREHGSLSPTRRVIVFWLTVILVMSGAGVVTAFAAYCLGEPLNPPVVHKDNSEIGRGKGDQAGATSTSTPKATPKTKALGAELKPAAPYRGPAPVPELPVSTLTTWDDLCPTHPGYDAKDWARPDFYALYLGGLDLNTDPPPGAFQGGCTGKTETIDTSNVRAQDGTFYYTVGTSIFSDQVLSVAVVSTTFKPAIFLSPAPKIILELLKDGPLGGEPRTNVGNGDLYLVHNASGVTVLIRQTKTLGPDSQLAQPYVELPPAVAQAWFDAIRERADALSDGDLTRAWLWPLRTYLPSGMQRFQLIDAGTGQSVVQVDYDPDRRTATREIGDHVLEYGPSNGDFHLNDLAPYMPAPPPATNDH